MVAILTRTKSFSTFTDISPKRGGSQTQQAVSVFCHRFSLSGDKILRPTCRIEKKNCKEAFDCFVNSLALVLS